MKVLLSVFECSPLKGSDSYVGWSYATNMSRFCEVYALTREENKNDIESYLQDNAELKTENLHFIYIKQNTFFCKVLYRINHYLGFLGSYFVWQKSAYKAAKTICKEQDIAVCHHVSIADFRCAGYLWKIGRPFIYGPVGGGQETPDCLKEYVKGHEKSERFRNFMNRFMTLIPGYKKALNHASLIYSSNDETTECIQARIKEEHIEKLQQMTELCIDEGYLLEREGLEKENCKTVHVIVSGRLIYRKGIAMLLDVVKCIRTDVPFVIDIFGDGNQRQILQQLTERNKITDKVIFHGNVSFDIMQQNYKKADIYVLPSLRESTGTAVFEAMANKLPVVALNQNGVKYVVEDDAGILVDVISKEQIIQDMAIALKCLIEDKELRESLGNNAFEKIKCKYTWTSRAKQMSIVYSELCQRGNEL